MKSEDTMTRIANSSDHCASVRYLIEEIHVGHHITLCVLIAAEDITVCNTVDEGTISID